MFELYKDTVARYTNLPRKSERKLIKLAQMGDQKASEELLLRHIGFFQFRIRTILFPTLVQRYGEDMLQECLLLAGRKIHTYNLRYRDKRGCLKPVYFRTYLWKAVTGLILQLLKRKKYEITFSDLLIIDVAWQPKDGQAVSYVYGFDENW